MKYFQYAYYRIPLYKYPSTSIINIFIPLWILGILNLAIFFQDYDFGGRVASLATLTLAFVALVPTIYAEIPPNPEIVLVELLVYAETFTSMICLLDSFLLRRTDPSVEFEWSTDIYFLLSLAITVMNIGIVLVMFLFHRFKWEVYYNLEEAGKKDPKFDRKTWWNDDCDIEFDKWRDYIFPLDREPVEPAFMKKQPK